MRKTRIIDGADGLAALRGAWSRLEHSAVSPMQQFIWAEACASILTEKGELRVVVVEEGQDLVAVAPLVRRHGSPCLEMLGVAEIGEPTDVLYANHDALRALADALADLSVPLLLKRFPMDSLLPEALKKSFRGRGVLFHRRDNSWPFILLDSSWAEPENHLNAGRRSDWRRAQRIAAGMGPVSSEVLSPAPAALAPLLEEAFAVEADRVEGKTQTAMALDPMRGAFYRQYAAAACEKGILRLCFLRIDGRAVAMQLAAESGGRLWLLKIGYDQRFARCSPGVLLLRETLRDAAARGLNSLEFLGMVEPWIRAWTSTERSCLVVRGYPFGLRGIHRLTQDAAVSFCRKLGRLPVAHG